MAENEIKRINRILRMQSKIRAKIRAIYRTNRWHDNAAYRVKINELYDHLSRLEQQTVSHRCKKCGRDLSRERSVIKGFGETCFQKLFLAIPWTDLVEYAKEVKAITQRNVPDNYDSPETIADNFDRVETEMLSKIICSKH